jgi:hypothetical protein
MAGTLNDNVGTFGTLLATVLKTSLVNCSVIDATAPKSAWRAMT